MSSWQNDRTRHIVEKFNQWLIVLLRELCAWLKANGYELDIKHLC
jgi:hypothetical protein